jgi:hypothetical protein
MEPFGVNHYAYVVTLAAAAVRLVRALSAPARYELVRALETELVGGPNAAFEVAFNYEVRGYPGRSYTATPLSVRGYTAIHRQLTSDEIERLKREQDGETADRGFYVIDILSAVAAFTRSVPDFPG